MDKKKVHKCLACESTNIVFGYLGGTASVFVPSGVFTMYGFKTRTFVCLNCGQVNQYLSKSRLNRLKEKFKNYEIDGKDSLKNFNTAE